MTRAGGGGPTRASVAAWCALLGGAAAWRWLSWSRTVAIFNDGPHFLAAAQAWSEGRWSEALAQPQHPLYPIAVALAHAAGLDWENAGAAVSVLGGSAAVGFAALFFREAFGARAAWLGAGLLAVHSRAVEFSSDVQSDGLYLGVFVAGIWLAWRAIATRSGAWATAAGVAAGLAYLTRPEGFGIALLLVAAAAVARAFGGWTLRESLRVAAAAACAAGLVAAPYVLALSGGSDGFSLTHKKSLRDLAGVEDGAAGAHRVAPSLVPIAPVPPAEPSAQAAPESVRAVERGTDGLAVVRAASPAERAYEAVRMVARTAKSALRYGPLALLVAGCLSARGRPGWRGAFLLALLVLYTAVLFALTFQVGYVSRRHALPPLVPLFGYVGLGAVALGGLAAALARRGPAAAAALATGIALAIGIGELARQLEPRRSEERAAVDAARWLRAHAPAGPLITDRLRLGYYAGMPYVPFVRGDDAAQRSFFDRAFDPALGPAGARYVLLDDPADVAATRRAAGDRLELLYRVEEGGREAWVFERIETPAP